MKSRNPIRSLKNALAFAREYHSGLLKGGITFVDNTLVYLFDKRPSRGPLFVNWNLLFNCNAKCSFCDTHELNKTLDRELKTEEALGVVRQLGEAGTWHLSLTGGETLLRRDLPAIIREAKRYRMYVNVNTNGALLAKKAQRLVDSGLDSIIISADSDESQVHDENRGIPDLLNAALRGIEAVKEAQQGLKRPSITLRMVVSRQNYQSIDSYIEKFSPLVDKISIQPIHDGVGVPRFERDENRNLFNIKQDDVFAFRPGDRTSFAQVFDGLYRKYGWLDKPFVRGFEDFVFDKDSLWERMKCYAGYYYLAIDPRLNTFPCTFFIDQWGSLRDRRLMDIWRSEGARRWRGLVKERKNECLCWCGIAEVNRALSDIENALPAPTRRSLRWPRTTSGKGCKGAT